MARKKPPNSNPPSSVVAPPPPSAPIADGFGRDLSNWLFPAFLGMVLLGFFCIWKFGSAAGNPNPVRSLFIAMNSATLSGFDVSPGVGGLNDFGQWTALLLIVCGSLFTMIVGGLAVIRIVRLPFTDGELILCRFSCRSRGPADRHFPAVEFVGFGPFGVSRSSFSPPAPLAIAGCISPICPSRFPSMRSFFP